MIHPTAVIDAKAEIHPSVVIGAYVVIDANVHGRLNAGVRN